MANRGRKHLTEVIMGIIKNRTTLNGMVLELVANEAVGQFKAKDNSFEKKYDAERTR